MTVDIQNEKRVLTSTNPADGTLVGELAIASAEEVKAAVQRAKAAQPAWHARGLRARLQVIRDFQRLLLKEREVVAGLVSQEAGKPLAEAMTTEVLVVLDSARFLLEHAYKALRPQKVPHGNLILKAKQGRLIREPYGVIGIIAPWNYPFSTPATETLGALAAGNTVVLKPSEFTPVTARKLESLLHAAGVPRDVFQVIIGEGPTGAALVESAVNDLGFGES